MADTAKYTGQKSANARLFSSISNLNNVSGHFLFLVTILFEFVLGTEQTSFLISFEHGSFLIVYLLKLTMNTFQSLLLREYLRPINCVAMSIYIFSSLLFSYLFGKTRNFYLNVKSVWIWSTFLKKEVWGSGGWVGTCFADIIVRLWWENLFHSIL